jgi:hypothetical protein
MIRALFLFLMSMMFFTLAFIYSNNVINIFQPKVLVMILLIWFATVFAHFVAMDLINRSKK